MRNDMKHLSTLGASLHFLFSAPKSSQPIVKVQEAINKCSSSYSLHSMQRIQSEYGRCAVNFNCLVWFFSCTKEFLLLFKIFILPTERKTDLVMKRSRKKDGLSDSNDAIRVVSLTLTKPITHWY